MTDLLVSEWTFRGLRALLLTPSKPDVSDTEWVALVMPIIELGKAGLVGQRILRDESHPTWGRRYVLDEGEDGFDETVQRIVSNCDVSIEKTAYDPQAMGPVIAE